MLRCAQIYAHTRIVLAAAAYLAMMVAAFGIALPARHPTAPRACRMRCAAAPTDVGVLPSLTSRAVGGRWAGQQESFLCLSVQTSAAKFR